MQGYICRRLCGYHEQGVNLWLSNGFKVEDDAQPGEFLPWVFSNTQRLGLTDVLDKLFRGYHWKRLTGTDLTQPATIRWNSLNETGPLTLHGLKQSGLALDKWVPEGWVYIFDKTYQTITVCLRRNWALLYLKELPLDVSGWPDGWYHALHTNFPIHDEGVEQTILLRYVFDFALKQHQENKGNE